MVSTEGQNISRTLPRQQKPEDCPYLGSLMSVGAVMTEVQK
jgi:hypothetical protein